MTRRAPLYLILAVGIIAISFGAILIRLTHNVPVLTIAAWRLGVATLILIPFGLRPRYRSAVTAREWQLGMASGVFLAFHFLFWIASLE